VLSMYEFELAAYFYIQGNLLFHGLDVLVQLQNAAVSQPNGSWTRVSLQTVTVGSPSIRYIIQGYAFLWRKKKVTNGLYVADSCRDAWGGHKLLCLSHNYPRKTVVNT
jgi:hypothetical protein